MSDSPAVLVAGGAGYIGSHTAKFLKQAGWNPVVLDDLSTGYRENVRYGPFYEGPIGDAALLAKIANEQRPVGAILFAGFIAVGESTGNPRKYFHNNITQAIALLDSLLDLGIKNIVFSSSAAVYGIQGVEPIQESSPKDPVSPYGDTKWMIERILHWYGQAYGLSHASLRYFNAAGADPDGELGERHEPETHLIPLAMRAALGGNPLKVFGTDYPTPDGTAIRDYIHVADLAEAHLLALQALMRGEPSCSLNLGTGSGFSVLEVIRGVERVAGKKVPAEFAPRREGDAPVLVADASKAKGVLGWVPRHSSLDNIVRTAWNWHQRKG